MRLRSCLAFVTLAVAACSTSGGAGDGGVQCPDIGKKCTLDSDCCTKFCQVLGGGAFCIEKPATDPACGTTGASCTQARHCCSRKCTHGACDPEVPPPPPPPCKSAGQACNDTSECCAGTCDDDPVVGRRCGSGAPDGGASDAHDASADAASD
jgi:hypothetical protein